MRRQDCRTWHTFKSDNTDRPTYLARGTGYQQQMGSASLAKTISGGYCIRRPILIRTSSATLGNNLSTDGFRVELKVGNLKQAMLDSGHMSEAIFQV